MKKLQRSDLCSNPFEQFERWYQNAVQAGIPEPEAISLATATRDGQPSARMVLLRGFDERGFTFYTNYGSRKGRELQENPQAEIVVYWHPLARQIRIAGEVAKTSTQESQTYFETRTYGSQLSAWASRQSDVVQDRNALEERLQEIETRFGDGPVPLPPFWGGFRLRPRTFEFWQHGDDRLHDRFRYSRVNGGKWLLERLFP